MDLLTKFGQLSVKQGLTYDSLSKNAEDSQTVSNAFIACLKDPNNPTTADAETFLIGPGNWLSVTASELLELAKTTKVQPSCSLQYSDLSEAVTKIRAEIKKEKKQRALVLEKIAKEKKIDTSQDEAFMYEALKQADIAISEKEVPVGAVIVDEHKQVIARSYNCTVGKNDPCGHAEIRAIKQAAAILGDYRLDKCSIYVTLEPCAMCSGAIINARFSRLIYGADEPKTGAVRSNAQLFDNKQLNHSVMVRSGVLADKCATKLKEFFAEKRER